MELEEAIFSQLSGYGGLSALVQSRIYFGRAREGSAWPHVTYLHFAKDPTYTYDRSEKPAGDSFTQFDVWGRTPNEMKAVAVQVEAALDAWQESGVNRARIVDSKQVPDPDPKIFHFSIDAKIHNSLSHP